MAAVYDRDASQRMGKEAYEYILEKVSRGVITAQHFNDISAQLHPHVRGSHLRRVGAGRMCDEAEFRCMLSDWFGQEMYDLDQRTVLKRLITIFCSAAVSLPEVGKALKQCLENENLKVKAVKVVVMLGESGAGKSSLGNCLLALDSTAGFKVSSETASCTKDTSEIRGFWTENGSECVIIDTPGLNDSDNEDTDHIRGIVEFLRDKERVNCFLVVRNGHNIRMNHSFRTMLSTFELTFGEEFWHHVVIGLTHTGYIDHSKEEACIKRWKKTINERFPKSANKSLTTVVLDAERKDHICFQENAKDLWNLVSSMPCFDCKDLTAVKTELDQVKTKNLELQEEVARLRDLAGVS